MLETIFYKTDRLEFFQMINNGSEGYLNQLSNWYVGVMKPAMKL